MSLVVKWNSRLEKAINSLQHLFNIFTLAAEKQKVTLELPPNVKIISHMWLIMGLLCGKIRCCKRTLVHNPYSYLGLDLPT